MNEKNLSGATPRKEDFRVEVSEKTKNLIYVRMMLGRVLCMLRKDFDNETRNEWIKDAEEYVAKAMQWMSAAVHSEVSESLEKNDGSKI